ncbi:hypothetical protein Forpe1208_v017018 [Fusarium oxysporum f. sp. rapae]|uniref:Uncharacterized protein n=1 Tax=Fusarium oxysporum f. sp. rapae TaxID=485398 RepID=A0A8J5NDG8_FUSOX|nr:hypothetical protein Forpe1208_v017018 [Fusarium oxysporum f. sp. rapae]
MEGQENQPTRWPLEIFRDYLVHENPIYIDGPGDWLNIIDKLLALVKEDIGFDGTAYQLLEEARRIFYIENHFIISFNNLGLFLDDALGTWACDMDPVETLVQRLTIQITRDEPCGADMRDHLTTVAHFAHWPRLKEICLAFTDDTQALALTHQKLSKHSERWPEISK